MNFPTTIRFMGFRYLEADFRVRQLQILLVGIFASMLAAAVALPLSAQDWTLDPQVRWRVLVPGRALTNYVATAPNGTVYVNSDERLMALEPSGNLQWEVLNTSDREARPINVRADGALVVGGLGFGQVTALNPDGSLIWAYNSSGNRLLAGPSLGPDGNVYAIANDFGTFSLDDAGDLRWVGDYFFSNNINNSPIVFDSSRFFAGLAGFTSSFGLSVYDLNNGREVWSSASLGIPWSGHPVLDPSGRVVGPRFPTWVQALEPEDGQLAWSAHHPGQVNFLVNQPKVGTNGVVYTSDISGADLWAINPDGTTLWFLSHGPNESLVKLSVSPDNAVIVGQGLTSDSQTGTAARWLRSYDTTDGTQLWQIDLPDENGVSPYFPGFDVAFTPDSRTAYLTTSYFPASDDYGYLYAIDLEPAMVGDSVADSVLVTRGSYVSGGVPELAASDDADLSIRRATSDIQSRTEFEVEAVSPVASPSSLQVTLEGSVFARSQVNQTIELFDYRAAAWEQVDSRAATRFTDSTVTVNAMGDLSRFVEAGTMRLKARIRYQSPVARQQFSSNTDQFIWTIGQ